MHLDNLNREQLRELLVRVTDIYNAQPVDEVEYRALVGKIVERMNDLDADREIERFAETLQELRTRSGNSWMRRCSRGATADRNTSAWVGCSGGENGRGWLVFFRSLARSVKNGRLSYCFLESLC
jgi:hypothetical protein